MEHISFAYYKLPNELHYTYLGSNCPPLRLHSLSTINEAHKGFLIAPFDTDAFPILLISPSVEQSLPLPQNTIVSTSEQGDFEKIDSTYLQHFKQCEELLNNESLQKIVLAHRFEARMEAPLNHRE